MPLSLFHIPFMIAIAFGLTGFWRTIFKKNPTTKQYTIALTGYVIGAIIGNLGYEV